MVVNICGIALYIYIIMCVCVNVNLQVQTAVADLKGRGGKDWHLTLLIDDAIPLCDGGLVEVVGLSHKFLSMTAVE